MKLSDKQIAITKQQVIDQITSSCEVSFDELVKILENCKPDDEISTVESVEAWEPFDFDTCAEFLDRLHREYQILETFAKEILAA
jgi:hypothetical protein